MNKAAGGFYLRCAPLPVFPRKQPRNRFSRVASVWPCSLKNHAGPAVFAQPKSSEIKGPLRGLSEGNSRSSLFLATGSCGEISREPNDVDTLLNRPAALILSAWKVAVVGVWNYFNSKCNFFLEAIHSGVSKLGCVITHVISPIR